MYIGDYPQPLIVILNDGNSTRVGGSVGLSEKSKVQPPLLESRLDFSKGPRSNRDVGFRAIVVYAAYIFQLSSVPRSKATPPLLEGPLEISNRSLGPSLGVLSCSVDPEG